MSKKNKTLLKGRFVKASESKKIRALHLWHTACLLVAAVLILSTLLCYGRPVELARPVPYGYANWTLQLFAAPCLAVLSLLNVLFGWQDAALVRYFTDVNPFLGLGLIALLWLVTLWAVIWRCGLRWFGSGGVRAAAHFAMIFAVWGMLQLLFSGLMFLRDNGGFEVFHPSSPVHAECAEKTGNE